MRSSLIPASDRSGRSIWPVASGAWAVYMHLVLGIRPRRSLDGGGLRDHEAEKLATRRQVLSLYGELSSDQRGLRRSSGGEDNQFLQNRCELKNQRTQRLAK